MKLMTSSHYITDCVNNSMSETIDFMAAPVSSGTSARDTVRPGTSAKKLDWQYVLFVLSFIMAMCAAVAMIVHAKDARGSGNENAYTPAFMMAVKAFKTPELLQRYQASKSPVDLILVAGACIAICLWAVALGYAL